MGTVLVVDDDEDICALLRLKLTGCGHVVHVVHDGRQALDAVLDDGLGVDVVLMDSMMPAMDGETACRALRADPRTAGLPVLMVSARGRTADVERGLAAGADGYVLKPFDLRELARTVDAALARGMAS